MHRGHRRRGRDRDKQRDFWFPVTPQWCLPASWPGAAAGNPPPLCCRLLPSPGQTRRNKNSHQHGGQQPKRILLFTVNMTTLEEGSSLNCHVNVRSPWGRWASCRSCWWGRWAGLSWRETLLPSLGQSFPPQPGKMFHVTIMSESVGVSENKKTSVCVLPAAGPAERWSSRWETSGWC